MVTLRGRSKFDENKRADGAVVIPYLISLIRSQKNEYCMTWGRVSYPRTSSNTATDPVKSVRFDLLYSLRAFVFFTAREETGCRSAGRPVAHCHHRG
jgi:hypothetical protein